MTLTKAFIPYGTYWSTPFCRWQGSFADEHAIQLAARVARDALRNREVDVEGIDSVMLGTTIPQMDSFYGAPWLAAMIGVPKRTGATIAQACATSARVLASAALEVEAGQHGAVLGVTCDRTSNGPHVYYPSPNAPGGRGRSTDWVFDAFGRDPWAKNAMIETAEKVARAHGLTREAQDEITLLRSQQYERSLKDDRAFQRRYMTPVTVGRGKHAKTVEADEGIHPTTAEGLAGLKPVVEGGTVTFGSQTHPADGSAGMLVCDAERAKALSRDPNVPVQILAYGEARVDVGHMPEAVVPAARDALRRADLGVSDCNAFKTHNPFAVNDLYFCREMGIDAERVNDYGSSLVYGHPQGPTGMRLVMELIEELAQGGGGVGLFTGCAAGDTAMALVVRVG